MNALKLTGTESEELAMVSVVSSLEREPHVKKLWRARIY
jgi:hypothetical protein